MTDETTKLYEAVNQWYPLKMRRTGILPMTAREISVVWDNLWVRSKPSNFSKKEELEHYSSVFYPLSKGALMESTFLERMGILILADQVSRYVFDRGEWYDLHREIALPIAHDYSCAIESLPIQCQLSVIICLCHSEDFKDQQLAQTLVRLLDSSQVGKAVYDSLREFSDACCDRIIHFGRIPEWNTELGRLTTPQERAFINSM